MVAKPISQLTELAEAPADGDFFPIVDVSAGRTKKIRADRVVSEGGGGPLAYPSILAQSSQLSGELIYLPDGKHVNLGAETIGFADANFMAAPFFLVENTDEDVFTVNTEFDDPTYGTIQFPGGVYAVSFFLQAIALGFNPIPAPDWSVYFNWHSYPNYEFNLFYEFVDSTNPVSRYNFSWTQNVPLPEGEDGMALDCWVANTGDVRDLGLYYSIGITRLDA